MLKAEVMRLMRLLKVRAASHPGRDQAASPSVQGHSLTSVREEDAACHESLLGAPSSGRCRCEGFRTGSS